MAFLLRSRLLGLLLILAALPLDPATALAIRAAAPQAPATPAAEAMEARLQRIAAAVQEREASAERSGAIPDDAVSWVGWANGGGRAGWANGGFRNGGFRNGGFRNGGFGNGGGWGNGGGGFRNFRNW